MHKKLNSMPKKVVSIFMALFIVILSAPFVFAAEPIALTESDVTVWPTASGEIYFGQKLSDGITLSGGEVQYNGTVVTGKFEFADINYMPTSSGLQVANINFVPENTYDYTGFNVTLAWSVTYMVNETIPLFVDENNDFPVATTVTANARLSTSTISGGKMYNPYNDSEATIASGVWQWSSSRTKVTNSSFQEAIFAVPGYTPITYQIWVGVEGDDTQPVYPAVIAEMPTIPELTYDPNSDVTYGSLLEGGKAVLKGTDTEIAGTFALTERYQTMKPLPTHKKVDVTFTPADTTIASFVQFEIPVTVNHAPLAFKDAYGNLITGEFVYEVEPNEKMSNIQSLIWDALIAPEGSILKVEDYYGYAVNGKTYKLTVQHENNYYEGANEINELYFTVKFKTTEISNVIFTAVGEGKWKVDCGDYKLPGEFTVYATLNGKETEIGKVKSNQTLEWMPEASGNYTFRVEYTPVEGDYFAINGEITSNPMNHQPNRYFTATGTESTAFKMGQTVKVVAPATDPAMAEEPYYGFTGWTVVSGNPDISEEQLANAEVSFAMPDENVELKANYKFSHELYFKWIWQQIVEAFRFVIGAFKELFGLAFVV